MTTDTFYAFECGNESCPAIKEGTGVVLDVRTPWENRPPKALCPVCGAPMHFRGQWPAEESGHGSRGDGSEAGQVAEIVLAERDAFDDLPLTNRVKDILRHIKWEVEASFKDRIGFLEGELQKTNWYAIMATGVNLLGEAGVVVQRVGVEWVPDQPMPFRAWISDANGDRATGSGYDLEQAAFGCALAAKAAAEGMK